MLPPGSRLGRYEILAKLAAGGMAVVYVARVQGVAGFQRLVALKVLHANLAHEAEFIHMFLDEARLAARIRHPNVVGTIDISGSAEAGYYLVMDYIEGDHLGRLLAAAHKAGERIPVRSVLRIVADALAGLGSAHDLCDDTGRRLNLVHRDVSPHNIMVGTDGVARLTDFGVAKAEDRIAHTRDGQVKGKLAYMAPEQASTGSSDNRSDLFAMGVILWECLTGRRLFRGDNAAATLNKLINEPIPPPSSVDARLEPVDALLSRALDRDPDARFPDAEAFLTEVERVAEAFGGLASQREVARLVRDVAGDKIERDRRMIRSAEAVVDHRGDGDEMLSEPSLLSRTSLSNASLSQSASKLSGAFSQHSALSFQSASTGSSGSMSLPPPPPAMVAEGARSHPPHGAGRGARGPGLYLRFFVLLVGVTAFAAVYLRSVDEGAVKATPIEVATPVQAAPPPVAAKPAVVAEDTASNATSPGPDEGDIRAQPTAPPASLERSRVQRRQLRTGRRSVRAAGPTAVTSRPTPAETSEPLPPPPKLQAQATGTSDPRLQAQAAATSEPKPSKPASTRQQLDDLLLDNPYQN